MLLLMHALSLSLLAMLKTRATSWLMLRLVLRPLSKLHTALPRLRLTPWLRHPPPLQLTLPLLRLMTGPLLMRPV
jgi:hypothetical protein